MGILLPMAMPSPATQTVREVLAGIVERLTFDSVETGFCVLHVVARGHRDLATIVGHTATISLRRRVLRRFRWQAAARGNTLTRMEACPSPRGYCTESTSTTVKHPNDH